MYIGKVSKLTGATPKAIRHYEAIGLITPPNRKGKYRYYSDSDIAVISFIKRAQEYGFKLSELRAMVKEMGADNKVSYESLTSAIHEKQKQIQKQLLKLSTQNDNLSKLSSQIQIQNKCPYT
jgi:MerR family copper efflux transcriptional regulator